MQQPTLWAAVTLKFPAIYCQDKNFKFSAAHVVKSLVISVPIENLFQGISCCMISSCKTGNDIYQETLEFCTEYKLMSKSHFANNATIEQFSRPQVLHAMVKLPEIPAGFQIKKNAQLYSDVSFYAHRYASPWAGISLPIESRRAKLTSSIVNQHLLISSICSFVISFLPCKFCAEKHVKLIDAQIYKT
jgi:hypothetical protein